MRNEFTDYIQHGHKYVAAIDIGVKAGKKLKRYFYSVPEYQAYLRGRRPKAAEEPSKYRIKSKTDTSENSKLGKLKNYTTSDVYDEKGKHRMVFAKDDRTGIVRSEEVTQKRGESEEKATKRAFKKIEKEQRRADAAYKTLKNTSKLLSTKPGQFAAKTAYNIITKNKKKDTEENKPEEPKKNEQPQKPEEPQKKPEEKKTEEENTNEIPKSPKASKFLDDLMHKIGFKRKSKETTPDEDCKDINPDWDPDVIKNAYNCAWCTFAFDLRRRGYDVDAGDIDQTVENDPDEIKSWYENAEWSSPMKGASDYYAKELKNNNKEYVDLYKQLLKEGVDAGNANAYCASKAAAKKLEEQIVKDANGDKESWGQTAMYWRGSEGVKNAGGHSIAYYQKDGEVTFYDCQTGEKIEDMTDTIFSTGLVWSNADGTQTYFYEDFVDCMRTDNKEIAMDEKKIKRSVEAGDDNKDTSKKNKNKKKFIDKY